jgi:hypothetical protein
MGKQAKVKDGVEKERRLFSTTALTFSRGLGYGRVLGLCGHKRLGVRARANRVGWVGE